MDFKKAFYTLTLLLAPMSAAVIYFHHMPVTDTPSENTSKQVPMQTDEVEFKPAGPTPPASQIDKPTTASAGRDENGLTKEDALEFSEWQYKHGYQRLDEQGDLVLSDYEEYPEAALIKLAAQGDPEAMILLARKNLYQHRNYAAAEQYFADASIHGYTNSLAELANLKFLHTRRYLGEDNLEQAVAQAEEGFAWLEVGLMRGDKIIQLSKSTYESQYPQDKAARDRIDARAKAIYEQLNQQRIQYGLGEFDNSYPKAMDALFNQKN